LKNALEKNTASEARRTILITGCSSGIGYCVAQRLKNQDYRVFATARKIDDVKKLRNEGFEAFQLDLTDSRSIQTAFAEIMQLSGGQLYALFNNGAYGQTGAVEDLDRETLRLQFETNVFGWQELTKLTLKVMRQQGYGRIVQNSSILGFLGLSYRGAYCASKYAIEGLSDALRLELKDSGIHISLIEPGPIESNFRANCLAHFENNIDIKNSVHQSEYSKQLARLKKKGAAVPFTLPAEAVYAKVWKALEAKKPKPRYYVTFPTYLFGYLKRILSSRALDYLISKI